MAAKRGTKVDRYPTRDDTALRIDSSIVRISGQFYYVTLKHDTRVNNILAYKYSETGALDNPEEYSANDDRIDVSSFPLGFVNCERECIFVVRPPYRRQKQGVSNNVLSYSTLRSPDEFQGLGISLTGSYIGKMLLNIYPSFESARSLVKDGVYRSLAFSRDFAVHKNGNSLEVFYQTNKIGTVNGDSVMLYPEYSFNSIMITELEGKGVTVSYA